MKKMQKIAKTKQYVDVRLTKIGNNIRLLLLTYQNTRQDDNGAKAKAESFQ